MSEFDLKELLFALHRSTGLTVQLLDAQFRAVMGFMGERAYCALLHNSPEALECCMRSDIQGFHAARDSGTQYAYTCPFGLSTAVTPIFEHHRIVGYLYVGGFASEEHGVRGLWRCVREHLGDSFTEQELLPAMERLPRANEERFTAFCAMARLVCEHIERHSLFPEMVETIGEMAGKYILENLHTKLTLGKICLNLHCSKATLTEHFRREYGITVMSFVNQKRLEYAHELLLRTPKTIRSIAEECGFSGVEYFSAQFKKYYGSSPLAVRKAGMRKFE